MNRDKQGQYTHSKIDYLCVCGHKLGTHLAERPRACINHETGDGTDCDCPDFKKARVKK